MKTDRATVEQMADNLIDHSNSEIGAMLRNLLAEKEAAERDNVYMRTRFRVGDDPSPPTYTELRTKLAAAEAARDASQVGSDRYEYVRTMNPQQFRNLWFRAIDDRTFDAAIDAARSAGNG